MRLLTTIFALATAALALGCAADDDDVAVGVDAGPLDTGPWSDPEGCGECPQGVGFPCPCDGSCGDDSLCSVFEQGQSLGVCAPTCETDDDCIVDAACAAQALCVLNDGALKRCGYVCVAHDDCPVNMACDTSLGIGICYPE